MTAYVSRSRTSLLCKSPLPAHAEPKRTNGTLTFSPPEHPEHHPDSHGDPPSHDAPPWARQTSPPPPAKPTSLPNEPQPHAQQTSVSDSRGRPTPNRRPSLNRGS